MRRDTEIFDLIVEEGDRQVHGIELIASENFVSEQTMEAAGSCLTNKYAEGYPNKRYYGGCEVVDVVEQIAIDRAKALFGAEYVNVQPHSGSQANTAVFSACLKPGDNILGFDLSHGGHLTHGSPVNFSGKLYNPVFYGVEQETGARSFSIVGMEIKMILVFNAAINMKMVLGSKMMELMYLYPQHQLHLEPQSLGFTLIEEFNLDFSMVLS